jgi:hypothetical protein
MKAIRHLGRLYYERRAAGMAPRAWQSRAVGVVVAARNRSGQRAENFLRTLRTQTMPVDLVDMTLVDYGSESEHAADLQKRCDAWRVRYIFLPVADHFQRNKSLALNIGLRHMPEWCHVALCTDIDMIFAPNFLEWVMRTQLAYPKAITLCQFTDLREEAIGEDTDVVAEFDRIRTMGELFDDCAVGPCLALTREWYYRVRGFDERMFGEDHCDTDLLYRAERDGMVRFWLNQHTSLLHQWHWRRFDQPRDAKEQLDKESYERFWDVNAEFSDHDPTIVRNADHDWGVLPEGGFVIDQPERRR